MFKLLPLIDLLLAIPAWPAAWVLKAVRRIGVHRLPACRRLLLSIGVFPIRNHYYEPQFDYRNKRQPFTDDRTLPGIDWNLRAQLALLASFNHADELADLPREKPDDLGYYLENPRCVELPTPQTLRAQIRRAFPSSGPGAGIVLYAENQCARLSKGSHVNDRKKRRDTHKWH